MVNALPRFFYAGTIGSISVSPIIAARHAVAVTRIHLDCDRVVAQRIADLCRVLSVTQLSSGAVRRMITTAVIARFGILHRTSGSMRTWSKACRHEVCV